MLSAERIGSQLHGLYHVWMGADHMGDSPAKQPVGKRCLFLVGQRLVFDAPVHTCNQCIRVQCFGSFDVPGHDILIDIIDDVGGRYLDAVSAICIIEQDNAEAILFQQERIPRGTGRAVGVGAGIRNL